MTVSYTHLYQTDEVDLFSDDDMDGDIQPIPREDYENRSTSSVWYGSILENKMCIRDRLYRMKKEASYECDIRNQAAL